jgi:hypothetical protein
VRAYIYLYVIKYRETVTWSEHTSLRSHISLKENGILFNT